MADDHRAVGCTLTDRDLFWCLPSLDFLYFPNPRFPGASGCCKADNTQPLMAVLEQSHTALASIKRWAVLVGGAVNLSAYFLTTQTYRRMRLTTQVYGNYHTVMVHKSK